ncbi:hypothetical protein [Desulfuromonas sp. TF]|uniref:hypothetical protein n=1 Tax=Desulfuromonas sp. TF TaxID=1232410 RepID=UPI00041FF1B5|nr:hypothetical protein [Desulfuromonas sp. TF]
MTGTPIEILRKAVAVNLEKVQESPTAENLKNWRESTKALEEAEADLAGAVEPGARRIKGIAGAADYLTDAGWKVSTSTLYAHRDREVLPRADGSGYYLAADLDEYARGNLRRLDGSDGDEEGAEAQRKKQVADTAVKEEQAENWRIRNAILRGDYVEKSFMEREFSSRAAFLKSDLETFWSVHALTIVELVAGDPKKVPALIERGEEFVLEWLDRYSRPIDYPKPKLTGGAPGDE